ncbi:hypothetical protein ElyMa_000198700 [Elysia marginata]|uniref:Uncharacterized protein n=1 Tax=Elysia marginata TaxID=1093978 RepID=A0AAV4EVZ7_9GAST|nr:hypothetical protein ElyMa_000198700 [Elysia marginata]
MQQTHIVSGHRQQEAKLMTVLGSRGSAATNKGLTRGSAATNNGLSRGSAATNNGLTRGSAATNNGLTRQEMNTPSGERFCRSIVASTRNGRMDSETWLKWLKETFVPDVELI